MRKKNFWSYNNSGYLFILPAVAFFLLIVVFPIIYNIDTSFFKWDGVSPEKSFIGIENYISLFKDRIILLCLRNALLYMVITVPLQMVVGFILAFLVSIIAKKYRVLATIYRTIFFTPAVIAPVFVGIIFTWIYEGSRGYLNTILRAIGLESITRNWIGDYKIAIYSVLLVYVWWVLGYAVVLYLAAMQSIPKDYYEAAEIDGANIFQQALHITFPNVRSIHFTLSILGAISALKIFPLVYSLTRGGPVNSTNSLTIYIYTRVFEISKAGYASAISILLLALALAITLLQLKLYRRR